MGLGGCSIPAPVSISTYAFDGASYAFSGKSLSDHAISAVLNQDCAVLRLFQGRLVCHDVGDTRDEELYQALAAVHGRFSPLNTPYDVTRIDSVESVGPYDGVPGAAGRDDWLAQLPREQRLVGLDRPAPPVVLATRHD